MDRPSSPDTPPERGVESLADAQDLRSVISAALTATPVDEQSLRRGVWTYVGGERDAGTPPGRVIVALTELVEAAPISTQTARDALTRDVILWCVEAYFGHLGGKGVGRGSDAPSADAVAPDAR